MQEIPINWLAVIVAAIIRLAVGAVWYSPVAFGKTGREPSASHGTR